MQLGLKVSIAMQAPPCPGLSLTVFSFLHGFVSLGFLQLRWSPEFLQFLKVSHGFSRFLSFFLFLSFLFFLSFLLFLFGTVGMKVSLEDLHGSCGVLVQPAGSPGLR